MPLSRGLREQLAANERTGQLEGFAAALLAVLEDPQVAESVADAVFHARRERRPSRPATTSRLPSRGRGQRG